MQIAWRRPPKVGRVGRGRNGPHVLLCGIVERRPLKWDVSGGTDTDSMFANVELFNGDLSKCDVTSVTDMDSMFYYADCLTATSQSAT